MLRRSWTVIALSAIVRLVSTAQGVTRIFKGKSFERFASANDIEDQDLVEAIERAENALIDADLGAGLIKQRLARGGQGKSGSFRAAWPEEDLAAVRPLPDPQSASSFRCRPAQPSELAAAPR